MMEQAIGQGCPITRQACWKNTGGPDGAGCMLYRPIMVDEIQEGQTVSREEWDCSIAWPLFLHKVQAAKLRDVAGEVEAFRKNLAEAKPGSPFGVIALAFSSMAQSVATTLEHKRSGTIWGRLTGKDTKH